MGVEERPAEVAGGERGAAGGGERGRDRERCERGMRERGSEGLVGSWNGPSNGHFPFLLFHDQSSLFFVSFKYLYMYYSSPRKTPSNAYV